MTRLAAVDRSIIITGHSLMMQAWADYLDALKAGAAVIPPFEKA